MNGKLGKRVFMAGGVFLLIIGAVHSLSLFQPIAAPDSAAQQLVDLAASYKFNLMGTFRSLLELMRGFSINFVLSAFGIGLLDLAVARERIGLMKRVALINVLWLGVSLAVSLRYFFIVPTTFLSIALLLFLIAWFALPSDSKA